MVEINQHLSGRFDASVDFQVIAESISHSLVRLKKENTYGEVPQERQN